MNKKVITKIELQKRDKERVNVYINDEFSFACSAELIYAHNLSKGKIADMEYLQEIIDEDNYLKCKNSALKSIERAYKTEQQVYDKLIEKGYEEKIVKRAMNFLKEYKFIDDEKFIKMYVNDKSHSYGRNRIKYELIKKGISEKLINEALSDFDKDLEEEAALKLAEKKYKILIKSETNYKKLYKKVWDYLSRNGYNLEVIQKVVKKIVREDFQEQDESERLKENDELSSIRELAEKRYRIITKSESDHKKIYKKLSDYLLRRGYSWESIKTVLKDILTYQDL
ncbi:recombination regulator RecX [Clostridium sp. CX1]|uniref:recombination regulator RecX n=1 Tax=Clostridium sp. CX1 TaxID=2978346 RepID=UPI0021C08F2A|nr:recombination regulator RecX [Clostridium sp. CX1]MCT8978138.1 recombination regulator RecX [Clostridium sp. CX1]